MRALIVTDSYPPLVGGANRSAQLLARQLAARGHSIEVVTAWQPGLPRMERDGEVTLHRIRDTTSRMRWASADPYKHNPPPFPDPEAVLRLRRLVRRTEPDLVHAYGWLAHSTATALVGLDIPLLLSARDYGNVCAVRTLLRGNEICDGPGLGKCLRCATSSYGPVKGPVAALSVLGSRPLVRRKASAVHSVSRYMATVMDRDLRPRAALEAVIPNFHEEDPDGQQVDQGVLARLPREPFILYAGALRRIKGIDELVAAYQRLEEPPPLVLAGPLMPDTPRWFPPEVTVLTEVTHATLMAIWDRAMFGVAPTKIPEGLGNVIHEAMSKGRAMIGTRPGGHEDMIEDGENGLLVPAGDTDALAAAMARLIAGPALRDRMGRRARERAKDFTAEVIVPQLERLYLATIEQHRERRR